ncbi:MAG: stress response translation initiation inhibitor YciH [archaeon]|nr:stress response translation initiation inhibitor YciH [archaeon]
MEICPKCGLPIQACVCGEMGKEEQKIKIELVKRKFGKIITLVSGFKDLDMKSVLKELKQVLACGGTIKNGIIELQGDHKGRVKPVLIKMGFNEDSVED